MNKKFLLIVALLGIILLVVIVLSMVLNKPLLAPPPPAVPSVTPAPQGGVSFKRINISGVETNNFLANPIKTNSRGDAVFVKTSDYQITYLKTYEEFIISLSTTSAVVRDNAEAELLLKLGITKEKACGLKVSVNTTYSPEQGFTTPKRTLSFCPAKQQEY